MLQGAIDRLRNGMSAWQKAVDTRAPGVSGSSLRSEPVAEAAQQRFTL